MNFGRFQGTRYIHSKLQMINIKPLHPSTIQNFIIKWGPSRFNNVINLEF